MRVNHMGLRRRTMLLRYLMVLLPALLCMTPAAATQTITYYHLDATGSPVAATNQAGALLWRETYKPYGDRTLNQAAAGGNNHWYTGKPYDSAMELSYFGARYYDPVVGRFMGIDPHAFSEEDRYSFNRYAYANNNPYKFVDPDGRAVWLIVLIPLAWMGSGAVVSGGTDAVIQQATTGTVRWGGIGGVLDAAGDGVLLGPAFGAAGTVRARMVGEAVKSAEAAAARDALAESLKYHPRVRQRGVQDPKAHNFPYSFDDTILKTKPIKQSDGSLLYRKPGTLNDKEGNFEIGVNPDQGTIFHRTFVGNK